MPQVQAGICAKAVAMLVVVSFLFGHNAMGQQDAKRQQDAKARKDAKAQAIVRPASLRFDKASAGDAPDFQKHVVPLLGRLGCNSAKCHGSFQGQGGLRLSLFGFDFDGDHAALIAEAESEEGRRLSEQVPSNSLILQKPTLQLDHEGGKRIEPGSWEHHLLLRWIVGGAKPASRAKILSRLETRPQEIVFGKKGETAQLKVIAVWEDGSREDVTCLCRFRVNDDAVASVDRDGRAASIGRGDTHVVAFYDNGVAAVPVMRPVSDVVPGAGAAKRAANHGDPIDRFVGAKLAK
ncbi:MAG: hypothetical protein N2C14_04995, partial [Planctomycetales bacterium]